MTTYRHGSERGLAIANRREADRKQYSVEEWYSCARKKPQTEREALSSVAQLNQEKGDRCQFVAYQCSYCGSFHVGRLRKDEKPTAIEFLGTRDDGAGFIAWFRTADQKLFGLNRGSLQRRMNSLPISIDAYTKAMKELTQRENDEDGDGET